MLDLIIWWTGASVLTAGAACAAAFVLGEAIYWTSRILWSAALRAGRTEADLRNMHTWVRAGKPKWSIQCERKQDTLAQAEIDRLKDNLREISKLDGSNCPWGPGMAQRALKGANADG